MRAFCVSNSPCSYRTDTGYCEYSGNGCPLDDTATIPVVSSHLNPQNTLPYRITQLVDISPESIEEIANAVVEKLRKVKVKHGHWIWSDDLCEYCCSRCGHTDDYGIHPDVEYCPYCGAKMDGAINE